MGEKEALEKIIRLINLILIATMDMEKKYGCECLLSLSLVDLINLLKEL